MKCYRCDEPAVYEWRWTGTNEQLIAICEKHAREFAGFKGWLASQPHPN